ncbi:MAG: hypothetical protein GF308_10770 [Candidatus Heimdallarchaeota archaeon]|nr:hypothetical protein [Candidatus Heimdallarchaeota archaeon]
MFMKNRKIPVNDFSKNSKKVVFILLIFIFFSGLFYRMKINNFEGTHSSTNLLDSQPIIKTTNSGVFTPKEDVTCNFSEIGQFDINYGTARDIVVQENIAYLANGEGLWIFNVSDPTKPIYLSHIDDDLVFFNDEIGYSWGIYVEDEIAFLADGADGLQLFNVSDPSNPTWLAEIEDGGYARNVVVSNQLAFVADGYDGLEIINVSDPGHPIEIGEFTDGGSMYARGICVKDNIAFVAEDSVGLKIINVTDPTTPEEIGSYTTISAYNLVVKENIVYLAGNGLEILDITNLSSPTFLSGYSATLPRDIFLKNDHIFLAHNYGMTIVNIANPSSPQEIGEYLSNTMSGDPSFGVYVSETHAFLAADLAGLQIFDITSLNDPQIIGQFDNGGVAHDVYISEDLAFVANDIDGLLIIDISNPENLSLVTDYSDGGKANAVDVRNDLAYIAEGAAGLEILDVSDPYEPIELSQFNPGFSGCADIVIDGDFAFIADYSGGIRIIDISDPANPVERGTHSDGGFAYGVFVQNNFAFVADYFDGLEIIDISNPDNPIEVGEYAVPGVEAAVDVVVKDGNAFIAYRNGGLYIFNVTDPTNPTEIGHYDDGNPAEGIFINNSLAFVAEDGGGLEIIDISNPQNPQEIGQFNDGGDPYAENVFVQGEFIYVADGNDCLEIIGFDSDNDELADYTEEQIGTNPENPDCDNDDLLDGEEINDYLTDPWDEDSDDDGFSDGDEIKFGTDPNDDQDYPDFTPPVTTTPPQTTPPETTPSESSLPTTSTSENEPLRSLTWVWIVLGVVPILILALIISVVLIKRKPSKPKLIPIEKEPQHEKVSRPKKPKQKTEESLATIRRRELRKIIESYEEITLERMAEFLHFKNTKELERWIINLPGKKTFYIKEDKVIIPKELQSDETETEKAIDALLKEFEDSEEKGEGKKS